MNNENSSEATAEKAHILLSLKEPYFALKNGLFEHDSFDQDGVFAVFSLIIASVLENEDIRGDSTQSFKDAVANLVAGGIPEAMAYNICSVVTDLVIHYITKEFNDIDHPKYEHCLTYTFKGPYDLHVSVDKHILVT
jgi:hypothetical protein